MRSTLGVPVHFAGELLGALYAHSNSPNTFHDTDVKRLQLFALQAGAAIHNAKLHRETKLDRDLLAAMADQLRNIRGEKEPEKLQQEIVRLACELLGCDFGGLCRNRPGAEEMELLTWWGFESISSPILNSYTQKIISKCATSAQVQQVNNCGGTDSDELLQGENMSSLMAAPFVHGTKVEAVLFVGHRKVGQNFEEPHSDILSRFAEQAAVAWRTSQLMGTDKRRMLQLEILHQIGDYIQENRNLEHIFHLALTGITASFGLGFNRAALFFLDEDRRSLIGKMGIGELEMSKARVGWEQSREFGLDILKKYLEALENDSLPQTPIERNIRDLLLACDPPTGDPFCQVLHEGHWLCLKTVEDLHKLPAPFIDAFAPDLPLAIIALRVRHKTTGLLVVDNKFTKAPITEEDIELLITFANTLSLAIDNITLLQRTQEAENDLRSLFTASNELLSSLDSETILQNLVEQARLATGAASVSAVLVDAQGKGREIATKGELQNTRVEEMIRPLGLSMEVMRSGEPRKFENALLESERVSPFLLAHNIVAGLCLPLTLEEKRIGVIWYHYKEPRTFSDQQIGIYQLYGNQAVLAWDIAERIRRLQRLLDVNNRLVSTHNYEATLQEIVESARTVLDADWTALWPYDEGKDVFVPRPVCTAGISSEITKQLLHESQTSGGTGKKVLSDGWVGVTDLTNRKQFGFVNESTHRLLTAAGVGSFQAVALRADDKTPLGVLYANYQYPQDFGETKIVEAKIFARHAALVLQKIESLDHVIRSHRGVRSATRFVTISENLDQTLKAIVEETRIVLDCDIVTLYTYDHEKYKFRFPPAMSGVRYPDPILQGDGVKLGSILDQVLETDDLKWSEDAASDPVFSQGGFVKREGVVVVIAAPLRFSDRTVGIMFVNFRNPHRLDTEELDDIRLFADIAAVAIHNTQLVGEIRQVKGYVGSHTAIEWMRMVSLSWGHNIRREVGTANGRLTLLRRQLDESQLRDKITENLDILQKTLDRIGNVPIIAPLSAEDAIESVNINDLVRAYLKSKRDMERYKGITFSEELAPELDNRITVRVSRPWLRQAFEVLVDNAMYAMQQGQIVNKQIDVSTRNAGGQLEIAFKDSGPGVPSELQTKLFKKPITKAPGSRGAGIGLLQAQAIVRTYGGDIMLRPTGAESADFVITLPIEVTEKE